MHTNSGSKHTKPTRRADAQPLAEDARGGFTLVELLMVLSVLVVLTAMSLPAVLRWQQGLPMEQAISILQLQLQETRIAAIRSGETWVLKLPGRHTAGRRYPESNAAQESPDWQFVLPARIRCQTQQSESADFMIICRPDGTVTECRLSLIDTDGRATIFRVDRLTGSASTVPAERDDSSSRRKWQSAVTSDPANGVLTC